MRRQFLAAIALALMVSCGKPTATAPTESGADAHGATAATSFTREANAKAVQGLSLDDRQDFEDARRGLRGGAGDVIIRNADGKTIWTRRPTRSSTATRRRASPACGARRS